jgi:hypothetical protein
MFEIKQTVVCVDDRFSNHVRQFYKELPKKDEIYTIRDLKDGRAPDGGYGEPSIYLEEIVSPNNSQNVERAFLARRFAPLKRVAIRETKSERHFFRHPLPDLEPAFA